MQNSKSISFLVVFMGLLVGLPALTTDIYLPSFPALASFFDTSASSIQMTLTATMIGVALGQLVIGPLSDKYGRKTPLVVSLAAFIVTTAFIIYTKDVCYFIALRFVQGFACSSGMVLSRAILASTYSGLQLAKALSVNTAILSVMPTFAPVVGGVILTFASWQGQFIFLLIISVVFLISSFSLKEPSTKESMADNSSSSLGKGLLALLGNKSYISNVLIFAFAMAVMFAYIASSPFIFQEHYHLSPLLYSILFGLNAVALAIGSLFASRFRNQEKALQLGAFGVIVMSVVLVATLFSGLSYVFFEMAFFVMFIFNGLIYPSSTTLALGSCHQNAGTASAILGTTQFLFGGIVSPLVGIGDILYSTSVAIVVCSLMVFLLVLQRMLLGNGSTVQLIYVRIINRLGRAGIKD